MLCSSRISALSKHHGPAPGIGLDLSVASFARVQDDEDEGTRVRVRERTLGLRLPESRPVRVRFPAGNEPVAAA
jgi:hypothetical protein